jgi:hypothetical protein
MPALLYTLGVLLCIWALAFVVGGVIAAVEEEKFRWLALVPVGLLAIPLIMLCFISGSRIMTRNSCATFGHQADYETTVIITNMVDAGTCYVDFNGRLVPKDQIWAEMRHNQPTTAGE